MKERRTFEQEIRELSFEQETRRAKTPLNSAAVRSADDLFYARHKEFVKDGKRVPLDPSNSSQAAARSEWMELYICSGGAVEGGSAECKLGSLTITVTDESAVPVPGVAVQVQRGGENTTGADGAAEFRFLAPGSYLVTAEKAGYLPLTKDFVVSAGQTRPETMRLTRIRPNLGGPGEKTVYLTFDDGPWAGTREVYELLKELDVPATFFFVGENARYYEQQINSGFLRRVYDDPAMQLANHSETHGRTFYGGFYEHGLRVNAVTLQPDAQCLLRDADNNCTKYKNPAVRRSVLMDFEYASMSFSEVLTGRAVVRPKDPPQDFRGKLDLSKLGTHPRILASRMPGTNIWRLPGIKASHGSGVAAKQDEADDLELNQHRIYGWDYEFSMSFEVADLQREEYLQGLDGRFSLYGSRYVEFDRPTQTGENAFSWVKAKLDGNWSPTDPIGKLHKPNKLILLMHERAFRLYKQGAEKRYLNYLRTLIDLCRKEKYRFDVIANY